MRKKIIATVIVGLVLGLVLFFVLQNKTVAPSNTVTNTNQPSQVELAQYTVAEVAKHTTEEDCWTTIGNNVYDITAYIPRHPGGDEILRACGADGTTLFTGRVTTDGKIIGSGEPHSASAQEALASYQIGELEQ